MIDEKRLLTIDDFDMPQLGRKRTVRIYLPKGYEEENEKKYKVLYMHDGQNLFYDKWSYSGHSWKVCETLDELQAKGKSDGIILVAVDNSPLRNGLGRLDEYSPWKNNYMEGVTEHWPEKGKTFGGEGREYAEFMMESLKPYIDMEYRTVEGRDGVIVGGSSMGALISLYIAYEYSQKVGSALLVSPAFWFAYNELKEYLSSKEKKVITKLYMDMGTEETSDKENKDFSKVYLDSAEGIYEILREKEEIDYKIFEGHIHNEVDWAKRFPSMMEFILGVEEDETL